MESNKCRHQPCVPPVNFSITTVEVSVILTNIILANMIVLGIMLVYLSANLSKHTNILFLLVSIIPLGMLETGSYFFLQSPTSTRSAILILLALAAVPLAFTAVSSNLGRDSATPKSMALQAYYLAQLVVLFFFVRDLYAGKIIDWITGILDQPLIVIAHESKYWIINLLVSNGIALYEFENTLRNASRKQANGLKFVLTAFSGFIVYFAYLSIQILLFSYISESMLLVGAAIIFISLILLAYAFAKHPFWGVEIRVSRRILFGCLSTTAVAVYLIISGNIIDLLRLVQPDSHRVLVPATVFALAAAFLIAYLSPKCHARIQNFLTRYFFRNKYDYRELWMKFSERSSGSLHMTELLARVGEFIGDSMFVQQVAVWLRSHNSETFVLAYPQELFGVPSNSLSLRLKSHLTPDEVLTISGNCCASTQSPFEDSQVFEKLHIKEFVMVKNGTTVLGVLGVGADIANKAPTKEDIQLLASLSNQLAHLIMTQRLSEELLRAREWESFNRFSSFILHDLKNLATLQSMTLENAKSLSSNPEFLTDAFATFGQTTEKMINLIASLSMHRGQFSLKQQPLNILTVIRNTFDDLKIEHRKGIKLVTNFPPPIPEPIISGDPELLQKAFTNILLNAIQSLPKGEGSVEIKVTHPNNGKITTAIKDTGCGISPEQLQRLFRPFQTSKKQGMGIGLCHTRSIIEVHGGHIHIESQVNAGTKVEIELPTIRSSERNKSSEAQNTYNR